MERQLAEPTQRQRVIDSVADLRAACDADEVMLMAPQAVGAPHLTIDEQLVLLPLLDHRHPANGHAVQPQPVLDPGSLSHLDGLVLQQAKAQPRRRDQLEVGRSGEELEYLLERAGDYLRALQSVGTRSGTAGTHRSYGTAVGQGAPTLVNDDWQRSHSA